VQTSGLLGLMVLCAGLLACNGSDERSAPVDAGSNGNDASHEGHEGHEGHDEVIPCPSSIPDFEPGMTVAGESEDPDSMTPAHISARLVSASPTAPRKFENNWVLEFIDREGQPIQDIDVEPDEPWMDAHGHGGDYKPTVVARNEPGQLEFDRINLKMPGPWRLTLNASSEQAGISDVIEIHVCVP
jgi:hypothetical protein